MTARPDHLIRVRVEGDRHHRQAVLAAELRRSGNDVLMPAVHAIELADRDDGFTPSCGHLVKALPAVHECPALLSSASSLVMPSRTGSTGGSSTRGDHRGVLLTPA